MSEQLTVICVPWEEVKVKGSTKVICQWCEAICGLSPATKEGAGKDPLIMCMNCFVNKRDKTKVIHLKQPTEGQIKEFKQGIQE